MQSTPVLKYTYSCGNKLKRTTSQEQPQACNIYTTLAMICNYSRGPLSLRGSSPAKQHPSV